MPTCVVQNELNHVLDLLDCEMVLGSISRVPVYSCYWTILQIARLDVLEAFDPRLVDTHGGLGEKSASHCVSLFCRTRAVTWN